METETIVLCYPVTNTDVQKIENGCPGSRVVVATQETIASDIQQANIFCGHAKVPVDWDRVVTNGKLNWIQSSAAGLDHCLVPQIVDSEVMVSGCSGLFANQVAEQTLALLYACVRRLPVFFAAQQKQMYKRQPTDILHGKTVSIVGFGGNGRRIAELLQNVAGEIIANDCFPEFEVPRYVELLPACRVNDLFERGSVVIVTLPLTRDTYQSIGEEQFSLLRPGSYFINVARGQVVDNESLLAAINNETIAFAGLDVIDPEPLPQGSPFWSHQRVILTPHVGAQSADRVGMTTGLFLRNLKRYRAGRVLINQVDKNLQIPRPEHRLILNSRGEITYPEM